MPSQAYSVRGAVLTNAMFHPTVEKLRLRPCLVTLEVNAKKTSRKILLQGELEVMDMLLKVAPGLADPAARASCSRQTLLCALEATAVRG